MIRRRGVKWVACPSMEMWIHTHTVSLNGTGGRIDTAGPNEKASQPAAPASTLRIWRVRSTTQMPPTHPPADVGSISRQHGDLDIVLPPLMLQCITFFLCVLILFQELAVARWFVCHLRLLHNRRLRPHGVRMSRNRRSAVEWRVCVKSTIKCVGRKGVGGWSIPDKGEARRNFSRRKRRWSERKLATTSASAAWLGPPHLRACLAKAASRRAATTSETALAKQSYQPSKNPLEPKAKTQGFQRDLTELDGASATGLVAMSPFLGDWRFRLPLPHWTAVNVDSCSTHAHITTTTNGAQVTSYLVTIANPKSSEMDANEQRARRNEKSNTNVRNWGAWMRGGSIGASERATPNGRRRTLGPPFHHTSLTLSLSLVFHSPSLSVSLASFTTAFYQQKRDTKERQARRSIDLPLQPTVSSAG